MGIPSYFSYVIRHLKCKKDISHVQFQSLFMDCNSIIYDTYHAIAPQHRTSSVEVLENAIIVATIRQIEHYIQFIAPSKLVFIAFDGVAPFAKMAQQRQRRFRTAFVSQLSAKSVITHNTEQNTPFHGWNTSHITPGTRFMQTLSAHIRTHFADGGFVVPSQPLLKIIVSGADEVGEGEHKLFQYMRTHSNVMTNDMIALYGLDADLIMLSLLHVKLTKNIFIFREEPHFGGGGGRAKQKPQNRPTATPAMLFMDINQLSSSVLYEMNCKFNNEHRLNDYIFICMLFGNDFLPHFPCLNLKTHGMQILLDVYRKHIGAFHHKSLVGKQGNEHIIHWKNVKQFIGALANLEHEHFVAEYNEKNAMGANAEQKMKWSSMYDTPENFENALNQIPLIYREVENYICPTVKGWEGRYYKSLFNHNDGETATLTPSPATIAMNYLEGLDWVFHYYVKGCTHWRWKYNYNYPPLLRDLALNFPDYKDGYTKMTAVTAPFSPKVQLAFVIPPEYHNEILGHHNAGVLLDSVNHIAENTTASIANYQWAFCRFFWESHANSPDVSQDVMRQWENELMDVF